MNYIVAIVGRPNVGKSTLFNRFTDSREAIVNDTAGTTRDRHYGLVEWNGKEFSIIDTGGYITNSDDAFESEIRKQVKMAIEESDAILFLVDVNNGITDLDQAVADILRRSQKKVFLVANKVDNNGQIVFSHEFYGLGLGEVYCVSSMTGSGTGDLLDAVTQDLERADSNEEVNIIPKIAVVGRPNVGKSSFVNALIGEERNIVTPIAGTTRDTILTHYNKFNHDFYLVDTAGLRKKGKVTDDIEFYSVMRAIRAIESSDICILMLDAQQGLESQDMNIFGLIKKNRKGIIIVVNKWDLVEKSTQTAKEYTEKILESTAPFTDIPIIFTSVVTKQRIMKVLEEMEDVHRNLRQKIATSKLNDLMLPIIEAFPPPAMKGKYVKIKYVTQLPTKVPSFAFFCNLPQYVKDPYKRFLENKLRENFDFKGVPIQVYVREK